VSAKARFEATRPGGAAPIMLTMEQYWQYVRATTEENPLYLFDRWFAQNVPCLAADWEVPTYYDDDLFDLLGDNRSGQRPDYRWLIVGAARSGSNWHTDPNGTAAWNATVTGAKKWVMFPPGQTPPAVRQSACGALTTTVSVLEWFLNYYASVHDLEHPPIEFVARAGEVVFVPAGWRGGNKSRESTAAPYLPSGLTRCSANGAPECLPRLRLKRPAQPKFGRVNGNAKASRCGSGSKRRAARVVGVARGAR